jgi:hypothetical protein
MANILFEFLLTSPCGVNLMGITSYAVALVLGESARKPIGMSLEKAARQSPIKVSQHGSAAHVHRPVEVGGGNQRD